MNHFPLCIDIKDKEVIVCGSSAQACDKIRRILPFSPHIRIIAGEINPEIEAFGINIEQKRFEESDLAGFPVFVIAAESFEENRRIARICRKNHIPVNAVDQPTECDFIFPSIVGRGDLCISITTGGRSPSASVLLRERIEEIIPDGIEDILLWMEETKYKLIDMGYAPKERRNILKRLVLAAFEAERPLRDEETEHIIKQ